MKDELFHRHEDRPGINQLFRMGLKDHEIGQICEVTASAVNKWRMGTNGIGMGRERMAQGYLRGLQIGQTKANGQQQMALDVDPPKAAEGGLFLVNVEASQIGRFRKLMRIGEFEFTDIDGMDNDET